MVAGGNSLFMLPGHLVHSGTIYIYKFSEQLTVIAVDGHIDCVLTNSHSEFIRCVHNACLNVFHAFKNIIIHNVKENRGG